MRLILGSIVYFGLTAALWYLKPRGDMWLMGSLLLGGIYMPYFMWAITRPDNHKK